MANVCAGGRLCGLCVPQDPPMDEILLRTEISRHTPMCAEKWPNHAAHRGAGRRGDGGRCGGRGRRSGGRRGDGGGTAVGGDGGGGGRGRRPRRPAPGAGAAATSAALPCGVRGISLRNGRGGRGRRPRRPAPARVRPRQARPSRVACAGFHFGTVAAGGSQRIGVRRPRAKAARGLRLLVLGSSAGPRFVRWPSVRPLALGRRARTRSRRGCRPRRTAHPCRSRSRRPSP